MLNARRHTGLGKAMMSVLIARISVKQFLCSHIGECSDGNVEKQQQRIHRLGIPDIKRIKDRITGFIDGRLQVGVNHSKGNCAHKKNAASLGLHGVGAIGSTADLEEGDREEDGMSNARMQNAFGSWSESIVAVDAAQSSAVGCSWRHCTFIS